MQILGIWLEDGDPRVIKNLKPRTWYPLGDISDCSHIFNEDGSIDETEYGKIQGEIENKQKFCNELFNINSDKTKINLNCIVGKNGSGKSSLLNLEYRIINNLACKISHFLPDYNQSYSPIWATGFNAELYYELNNTIYCIKILKNGKLDSRNYKYRNARIKFLFANNKDLDTIFNKIENVLKTNEKKEIVSYENKLLKELANHLFYSISSNYSIYSNSCVYDKWENINETWQNQLFHKNDGYLTPIVLVPYKDSGATIDTEKELTLAEERVSTLALLSFIQDGDSFIENLIPLKLDYKLKTNSSYKAEIKEKYYKTFGIRNKIEKIKIQKFHNDVVNYWGESLSLEYGEKWKKFGEQIDNDITKNVKQNMLEYLAFKTVKMCFNYNLYNKNIESTKIKSSIKTGDAQLLIDVKNIIDKILKKEFSIDFTNLKVFQCLEFITNGFFYLFSDKRSYDSDKKIYSVSTTQLKTFIKEKIKKDHLVINEIDFDYVFVNLLPPFFIKDLMFTKKVSKKDLAKNKDITIANLSSGESQLLNEISYSIYHMKNASSNQKEKSRIHYKNMNLIIDEAELYYHPEYQRKYISDLLKIIGRSNFTNIDSINITIVTHSPFMLSDIPNSNILALENGEINKNVSFQTLGTNIYDLLKQRFFMDSTIGDHTEKIIGQFIDYYKKVLNNNTERNEESDTFYSDFIDSIGDDYLHKTLNNMFQQIKQVPFSDRNKKDEYSKQIEQYERKIKELKNKMEKLNEEN